LNTELHARRCAGAALGSVAQESLGRYFTLLAVELGQITLSRSEALLLCSVLKGKTIDDLQWPRQATHLLVAELCDSASDGHAERLQVDLQSFTERVRGWTRVQALAVVDAVERFCRSQDGSDTDVALALVGLVRG
jgi:hypothetical protein